MNVTVVGSGYVGLVVGACLAETGNHVVCADIDEGKVDRLNAGEVPIYEPGLDRMISRNLAEGRLRFTTDVAQAVRTGKVVFIAVGTPPDEDGSADLQHVLAVAAVIGQNMNDEKVVITKSTVPVGTAAKVLATIEAHTEADFHVCSNPEFLKEGAAVDDFMRPDRVVCGVESDEARAILEELYEPFVRSGNPLIFMDIPSAELTKYAANAMLQREAYLTSCDISARGSRGVLVGWRLVGRSPDEYGSAVVEAVLERAGFDVGLREQLGDAVTEPVADVNATTAAAATPTRQYRGGLAGAAR